MNDDIYNIPPIGDNGSLIAELNLIDKQSIRSLVSVVLAMRAGKEPDVGDIKKLQDYAETKETIRTQLKD
jgi:hypothetical protein